MALANGIGFLCIFIIELLLTIFWIKKFKLWECSKPNTVSFHFYARWFLAIIPLLSGFDNLRLFFGSFLNESIISSNGSKHFFIFVSFLHFVLLPLLIIECGIFITEPKLRRVTIADNDDVIYSQSSSKSKSCIWCFVYIITFILIGIGMYGWITLSFTHSIFKKEYGIYQWQTDKEFTENELNIIQIIAEQQPIFVAVFTLIMNTIICKRYRYLIPFCLTLLTIISMGLLAAFWKLGFFYFGNLFEFTLYLSYYKLDVFMYWLKDERKETNMGQQKYYEL